MSGKSHYIMIGNLCLCELPMREHYGQLCGHPSKASATRAVRILQTHHEDVTVWPGDCPVSQAVIAEAHK